jgi:nucleotide-binding universal stress UspA family protein
LEVSISVLHREGRNYIKLLEVAEGQKVDLIVMGAHGLENIQDGFLGSTVTRVLLQAPCDLLIVRRSPISKRILVGLDGSEESAEALEKAVKWGQALELPISIIAAYDPQFHARVFDTVAESSTPARQEEIGLAKQKTLHDQLIDSA